MARHEPDPPITEPEIVHCLFSTGTEVEVTAHFARIVAWVDIPRLATELPERRIIARVVLPEQRSAGTDAPVAARSCQGRALKLTPRTMLIEGIQRIQAGFRLDETLVKQIMIEIGAIADPSRRKLLTSYFDMLLSADRAALDAAGAILQLVGHAHEAAGPEHLPNAYSPSTLAKRWMCSDRHIRNMIKRGDLPHNLLGGKLVRIRRSDVEEYERRSAVIPGAAKRAKDVEDFEAVETQAPVPEPAPAVKRPRRKRLDTPW